jgi:hypothetical protein
MTMARPQNVRVICSRAVRVRMTYSPKKWCASSLSKRLGIEPHPRA